MVAPIQVHDYVSNFRDFAMAFIGLCGIAALWFGIATERKESR